MQTVDGTDLRSNARTMRLVAMRIRISSQNHEADRRLRATELYNLVKIGTPADILTTRRRSTSIEVYLERKHRVAAVVCDPQHPIARVVVGMAGRLRVLLVAIDEFD